MIVKIFRGISKDFAELTRRLKWKKLQIILVVDLEPFNDTWQKKRSVGSYRHRRNLIGNG
jgi:hypothetical protein